MPYKLIILLLAMVAVVAGCADSSKPLADKEIKPQEVSDIERGRYVVELLGCNDCHTPGYMVTRANIPEEDWLIGGSLGFLGPFGTVYPTNLRLLLNSMSEEEWLVLARQMRKDSPMAWVMLPETSEQDLRAVYRFVKYLGPKGTPTLARLPAGVTPTTPYVEYPKPH
jgi:hypothetical protein